MGNGCNGILTDQLKCASILGQCGEKIFFKDSLGGDRSKEESSRRTKILEEEIEIQKVEERTISKEEILVKIHKNAIFARNLVINKL